MPPQPGSERVFVVVFGKIKDEGRPSAGSQGSSSLVLLAPLEEQGAKSLGITTSQSTSYPPYHAVPQNFHTISVPSNNPFLCM